MIVWSEDSSAYIIMNQSGKAVAVVKTKSSNPIDYQHLPSPVSPPLPPPMSTAGEQLLSLPVSSLDILNESSALAFV